MTIAAGINHDVRPFRCYMPFYSQCAKNLRSLMSSETNKHCAKNLRSLMNTAENILCVKNLRSLMSSAINKQCAKNLRSLMNTAENILCVNNQLSVINYQSSSLLLIIPFYCLLNLTAQRYKLFHGLPKTTFGRLLAIILSPIIYHKQRKFHHYISIIHLFHQLHS